MKTKALLFLITATLTLTGVSVYSKENSAKLNTGNKKILVAYFSHTGNTREIAGQIHQLAGGDIFEIKAVNPYPDNYNAVTKQAKEELKSGFKPALKTKVKDIGSYDIIFIGYPI